MNYSKLLEKQIEKNLPPDLLQHPQIKSFVEDIHQSYKAFDKEKNLLTRAYKITEEEYVEVNKSLSEEVKNRKNTIQYLKQAIDNFTNVNQQNTAENILDYSSIIVNEINKRQQAENTLTSLVNNLNLGIVLKDANQNVIYINKVTYNLFKLPNAMDIDFNGVIHKINAIRSTSIVKQSEFPNSHENYAEGTYNSRIWNLADGRIIEELEIPYLFGENQKGVINTFADVTEKEISNEIIRKSELRNSQILKGTPDSVILFNANGQIKFTNEKACLLFNLSQEEINLKNINELIPLQAFSISENLSNNAFHSYEDNLNEVIEAELLIHKQKLWIELSVIKMEEINEASYCCFIRDITLKKKHENEIYLQKKFTEDILDNIPNDIAVFDENHTYLFVNERSIKDEHTRKWIIGKNDFDYCNFKNTDTSIAIERRSAFLKSLETKVDVEWIDKQVNKAGESEYFQRKFHPYWEDGKIKFVIGYGVEITANIKNQLELEKSLENVKKINNELAQFAHVASHDLQEPLRTISNFLLLIDKRIGNTLDEKTKSYINFTIDAAKRMRLLILDLLEYSKADKISDTTTEDINLNELVQEIMIFHNQQIEELGATIHFKNLPVIQSHKSIIRQVFQNFISNSLKYHKEGIQPEISICSKELDTHWQFSIADNGIGIDPQYFEKIFLIFQRLHNNNQYTGTGIGLTIIKKIIESLNGKIWVESKEGKGTTFNFTIEKKNHTI